MPHPSSRFEGQPEPEPERRQSTMDPDKNPYARGRIRVSGTTLGVCETQRATCLATRVVLRLETLRLCLFIGWGDAASGIAL